MQYLGVGLIVTNSQTFLQRQCSDNQKTPVDGKLGEDAAKLEVARTKAFFCITCSAASSTDQRIVNTIGCVEGRCLPASREML